MSIIENCKNLSLGVRINRQCLVWALLKIVRRDESLSRQPSNKGDKTSALDYSEKGKGPNFEDKWNDDYDEPGETAGGYSSVAELDRLLARARATGDLSSLRVV